MPLSQNPLHLPHSEDVSGWTAAIAQWLAQQSVAGMPWSELELGLGLPWVEICLGLLLGGFVLEQRGEFYQQETIWMESVVRK